MRLSWETFLMLALIGLSTCAYCARDCVENTDFSLTHP